MPHINPNRFTSSFSNPENAEGRQPSSSSEQQYPPALPRESGDTPPIYAASRGRRRSALYSLLEESGNSSRQAESENDKAVAVAEGTSKNKLAVNFRKENDERLLNQVREHVKTLKRLKENKEPPRDFIAGTRDSDNSELLIEEIIASENERESSLNLSLCRTAKAFACNIDALAGNGAPGQKARYITTVRTRGLWHVVTYEAAVVAPGKIYIRGFDALPESRAQKYFDAMCVDIEAACQGKNHQIKLDIFATGQQHSPAGCDIFALSFALKSLDEQFDTNLVNFEEGKSFDFRLIADETAEHLPIPYYKHAQPREVIEQIKSNPRHAQDIDKSVDKKELSLEQRYDANETTQRVFSFTTRKYQSKTFSDSIDAKRITFYERLTKRLEQRLQA